MEQAAHTWAGGRPGLEPGGRCPEPRSKVGAGAVLRVLRGPGRPAGRGAARGVPGPAGRHGLVEF